MRTSKKKYHNFTREDLAELLELSNSGNNNAFDQLAGYIRDIAYSYFLSKVKSGKIRNKDDADDLANNVFLAFAGQYQKIENVEHWLRKVMFLSFVNWYKKQNQHLNCELNVDITQQNNPFEVGDSVDLQKITGIIEVLKDEKKNIIKMRFWEGLKFSEISEKLNKNEAAVKKTFYRTIEEIKKKLE